MKTPRLIMVTLAATSSCSLSQGATISQAFEPTDDPATWGAAWTGGTTTTTFLDPSIGGTSAGAGASQSQSFSRSFKNNTVGLDLDGAYTIQMHVQLETFDGPSGGVFEIVDGDYGSGNAANVRVTTTETVGVFKWQARDNSTGWQDLGIGMTLSTPYLVTLSIDPDSFSYSAMVQEVTTSGSIVQTGSLASIAFDTNVINNNQNGNLLFYIQASAGGTAALVDNINIQGIPEPSLPLLTLPLASVALTHRRRTPSAIHPS